VHEVRLAGPATIDRRLARACNIADFVNHNDFIDDPNPPEVEVEDEDMEDAEDAPEADPAPGSDVPRLVHLQLVLKFAYLSCLLLPKTIVKSPVCPV
jgi:hypothetical protein